MTGQVDRTDLGAWLLRCNPRVWDLERYWLETDGATIDTWSVGDSYRSTMMQPGDRILLWVGGQSRKYERGIWGDGSVTGETLYGVSSELVSPYWRTSEIATQHQNFCQIKITQLLDTALTDRRLREAGITDLEVQRLPQGISPSWVTKDQLNRIDKVTAEQPDPVATLARSGGASPTTPTESRRVELAAMREVTEYYVGAGWTVRDVSMLKLGWDLTCTKGRREARVEVKGLRGPRPIIFLTRNELRAAEEEENWYLAIVTRALDDHPQLIEYEAAAAINAARPSVYRANLESDLVEP